MPNPVRIPDDTRALHNIGNFIMSYEPYMNAYLNALVNRIGLTLITSRMWADPWAQFSRGKLEYGETVQEIFANIAKPHSYDPQTAETDVFKREIPDVRAAFHSMDWQKFYKTTISNDQLRQAFLSFAMQTQMIAAIVDSLYTSLNLDMYLTKKYMLCREALNGGLYVVTTAAISGDGSDLTDAIKKFREYTNNLKFLKTTYNRAHVRNSTPIEDQIIIIPNNVEATLGVDVLANAFQLNQVDYISRRIPMDSFEFDADDEARLAELFANDSTYKPFTGAEKTALQAIVGCKLDRNWFMIFENFRQFTENYNGQGLYWQYFLHAWETFSVSPYANGIVFTTQTSEITGVTVAPTSASVTQGASFALTATVAGEGLVDKTVTWSISGQTSSGTNIDAQSGVLHVASNEPADTVITVTATAVDGQDGTATITVAAAS